MEDNHPPERADRKAEFLAQIVQVEPGAAGFTGLRLQFRQPLQILMALVGFVLLIACANMANLLTARASARHKEVAIRLAMGAGRGRIIRQFLTESLLLAIAGAIGGFVIAIWATRVLIALVSSTAVLDLRPDWRVLLFTALAAIATGLLFGIAPALRATRAGIGGALKERVRRGRTPEGRLSLTRVLLAIQASLSIVLLAAAGLLAGSLVRLLTENPGFDIHDLTMVSLDTTKLPQKGAALLDLYGGILARAKTLPDVESASLMAFTPLTNSGWDQYVTFPGSANIPEDQRDPAINPVSPGLLRTMRIPLIAGRDFTDADTGSSMKVAIISENAARQWFPNGALGADLVLASEKTSTLRIVGIAADIKYSNLRDDNAKTMYLPYTQWNQGGKIAMRTKAPVRRTYALFRDVLRQVAPGTPIRTIKTMEEVADESLRTERLTAYLSLFFAGLALLLTAVGLYGILAYNVSRRTSEIGIRMALGAQRSNVIWIVIRDAMSSASAGALIGIAAVIAASKLLTSLLYEVRPNDPATMVMAVVTLGLVCGFAAWLPARRACRLDPMVALREE